MANWRRNDLIDQSISALPRGARVDTMPPMRWLLCGQVDSVVAEALRRHGHSVVTPPEIDLGADASPVDMLQAARQQQLDIMTSDVQLPRSVFEQDYWFDRSIVLLLVQGPAEQADAVERLFARYPRLTPKRLYTITDGRVKIRQLPARR